MRSFSHQPEQAPSHARAGDCEKERIADELPTPQVERLRRDLRGGRSLAKLIHRVWFDATKAPEISTVQEKLPGRAVWPSDFYALVASYGCFSTGGRAR